MTKVSKNIYKRDPDRRRIKQFYLSADALIDLVLGNEDLRLISNIPKDCTIRNVDYDIQMGSFRFILQSKDFPEKSEGDVPEIIHDAIQIVPIDVWRSLAAKNVKR